MRFGIYILCFNIFESSDNLLHYLFIFILQFTRNRVITFNNGNIFEKIINETVKRLSFMTKSKPSSLEEKDFFILRELPVDKKYAQY